jgi:hypothetical protein
MCDKCEIRKRLGYEDCSFCGEKFELEECDG